ncbi:MAG: hypothetical protein D8M58_04935 [Calditrichaeota bacterium]|nr:MAG: hypothetical protein DWQ03_02140 [Calditrichota bacterium]MBL1204718.1 hypothetical protein [Calditrichota bacterium]
MYKKFMGKLDNAINLDDLSIEDYQKLVENLRIRINVLNASIFLLEDKLDSIDNNTVSYLEKINSELENIRRMILPYPIKINSEN